MGRDFPPQLDPYPLIQDICISNNVIKDCGSYGIVLGNVSSGKIINNQIDLPFNKPGVKESAGLARAFDSQKHDLEKPADPRAYPSGILVYSSEDVVLSGNTVTPSVQDGGVLPLLIGPWCRNIQQKADQKP
jgi:parallel beta-helix repeat protein